MRSFKRMFPTKIMPKNRGSKIRIADFTLKNYVFPGKNADDIANQQTVEHPGASVLHDNSLKVREHDFAVASRDNAYGQNAGYAA
ncbi:MAG: hypothetical protein LBS59_05050 [Puniceicoccales bacterium]|nr:hypothetical protein [Puniceicoccales bacterium]